MATLENFFLFLAAVLTALQLSNQTMPTSGANNELRLAEIVNQIDVILREQHNVQKPEMAPSPDVLSNLLVHHDVKLTVPQAERMLAALKAEVGADGDEDEGGDRKKKRTGNNGRRVFPDDFSKWEFPIKYVFDGSYTDQEKDVIREGIEWWRLATCAEFQEFPTESKLANSEHIVIAKGDGCSSYVGRTGNMKQVVTLGSNCITPGISAHEFGHVLGMWHEHTRPDRDDYIQLKLANSYGPAVAFAKVAPEDDVDYGTGYDLTSIMHYDALGFSANYGGQLKVIETLDPYKLTSLGQRTALSFTDAKRINMHYNCSLRACSKIKLSQPCQNGGYQDPRNCARCRCPSGISGDFCDVLAGSWSGPTKCGGVVEIAPCNFAVLTSPSFPEVYAAETKCSWLVKTSAKGIIFAQDGQPMLPCTTGLTCIDYFEIRSNFSELDKSGRIFCKCGKTSGRLEVVDGNQALVYFHSAPARFKGGNDRGFRLTAFATCGNTLASHVSTECVITDSGYDYTGSLSKTDSGSSCMAWAGQSTITATGLPDDSLLDASNCCRNPNSQDSPWCYTNRGYSNIEHCTKIPKCDSVVAQVPVTQSKKKTTTPVTTTAVVPTKKPIMKALILIDQQLINNRKMKPAGAMIGRGDMETGDTPSIRSDDDEDELRREIMCAMLGGCSPHHLRRHGHHQHFVARNTMRLDD